MKIRLLPDMGMSTKPAAKRTFRFHKACPKYARVYGKHYASGVTKI